MKHTEDQADAFGTWDDITSRLMYHDIMPLMLSGVDTSGRVADFGGANGLLKEWIPQAVSVDYDPSKKPDVVGDISIYAGAYDLVVMRYVLHYMSDTDATKLLRKIARMNSKRLFIIQFANDDLTSKLANSIGERKWFRDSADLFSLLAQDWNIGAWRMVDYEVTAEFYRNRLNHPNPSSHREKVYGIELHQ